MHVPLYSVYITTLLPYYCTHVSLFTLYTVDKDRNTCTVRMVADHVFYQNVGQGQESTVSK